MEKLALEIFNRDGDGSKFANLPSNTSITIFDTSELFDSGDIWTYSFKLNIYDNAHIFGSAGEMHGSRLHEQVDKLRARLWVLGLPLYYGYIRLGDEVEVEDNGDVDISFESGQKTFMDMIEGAKANQVPLKDDILIGMALIRERSVKRGGAKIAISGSRVSPNPTIIGDTGDEYLTLEGTDDFAQIFPKYVRPDGTFTSWSGIVEQINNTINTDSPYDASHPYCNTRICYQEKEYKTNNGNLEKTALREYKICEPRRINPSPNFYVLYWFECLMKHLNIYIDENQLMGVEDLKRLFFLNTKCAYTVKGNGFDDLYSGDYVHFGYQSPFVPRSTDDEPSYEIQCHSGLSREPKVELMHVGDNVINLRADGRQTNWWQKAYASSENFPDVDIKDVVEAIENGFGMRLLFNDDYTKVRMVLLRNVLGSQTINEVSGEVIEVTKQENSIRGFRLTYGAGEENTNFFYRGFSAKLTGKKELWPDTNDEHDYSQWDMTKHYADITDEVRMLNKTCYVDMSTGNAYIVKIDENFKNASDEAFPSLFNCADFMDAEDGDCTGDEETIHEVRVGFSPVIVNAMKNGNAEDAEDPNPHIYAIIVNEEMSVPYAITSGSPGSGGIPSSSTLIDKSPESVWNETKDSLIWASKDKEEHATNTKQEAKWQSGLMEIATATPIVVKLNGSETININFGGTTRQVTFSGWLREGYRIYLDDNYEINDEMECPLENHEWGLTLGIMRGSGSDANVYVAPDEIEKEDPQNDYWDIMPGTGAYAHSDICDDYGDIFDYTPDGQDGPQDMTGRFSLKLRAEKPNPYYDPNSSDSSSSDSSDEQGPYLSIDDPNLQHRGLADQFYKEYSYWVRNARIAKMTVRMELAQLLSINKTVRQRIGDITGFVKKMQFNVDIQTGMSDVELEMWYL